MPRSSFSTSSLKLSTPSSRRSSSGQQQSVLPCMPTSAARACVCVSGSVCGSGSGSVCQCQYQWQCVSACISDSVCQCHCQCQGVSVSMSVPGCVSVSVSGCGKGKGKGKAVARFFGLEGTYTCMHRHHYKILLREFTFPVLLHKAQTYVLWVGFNLSCLRLRSTLTEYQTPSCPASRGGAWHSGAWALMDEYECYHRAQI